MYNNNSAFFGCGFATRVRVWIVICLEDLIMRNKVFVLLLLAACSGGCVIAFAWRGDAVVAAACVILAAAFAAIAVLLHYYGDKDGEAASEVVHQVQTEVALQPSPRTERYEEYMRKRDGQTPYVWGQRSGGQSGSASQAIGSTQPAVERGVKAFHDRPTFWIGIGFAMLAAISFFAGMTGMVTTWKALHAAGAFAIISAGFFASEYEQWAKGMEFAAKHWNALWLTISVLGILVVPLHKNWPAATMIVAFALSGIAALITILDGWPWAKAFLGKWLFTKGWISGILWVFLVTAIMLAYIMPSLTHSGGVTRGMSSVMSFYATGLIALGVIIVVALWKKS